MSDQRERDPLEDLARSNPVDPRRLPSASLARVDASVRREIATEKERDHAPRHRPRRQPTAIGVALAGTLVAIAVVAVLARGPAGPSITPAPSAPLGNAACVEQYSPTTLANRAWAFDGTVTEIVGDRVTFAVTTSFRGSTSAVVTLEAAGMTGTTVTSAGGPTLVLGGRYLVAGEDRFVWGCGFTQPYDADVAATWAEVLGD